MMKISNRLMSIDMNEMERLTYQTRKILLRSYLQRGIAPPFWIVAPNRPRGRTGEATAAPKSRLGTIALLAQI